MSLPAIRSIAFVAPAEESLRNGLRAALSIMILLAIWLSTRPFMKPPPAVGVQQSGDIVNQLTFAGLALLAAGLLAICDRRALLPLIQPAYMILIGWIGVCVVISTEFPMSMRAFQFALVVIFLAAALLALAKDEEQFGFVLMVCAGLSLAVAISGVIALPGIAKHTDFDPFEPEHAGSWRGHFDHKNIAGAMMGVFIFISVYLIRSGRRLGGWLMLLGSFVFLYFTKSKTSLVLAPAVVLLAFLVEWSRPLALRLMLAILPVLLLIGATLGSVLFKPIMDMVQFVVPGTTYTGRVDIWRYGFEKLAERPFTGYGFESFWLTSTTLYGESKLELAWSVDKIVHGHNGYLDIGLTMGIPGLLLVAYVFLLKPVLDYHAAARQERQKPMAHLFLMMWLFISLNMCLESYFFRRSDPVWFSLLIAVIGLHFLASASSAKRR
jgi:O-antigen ligase